VTRAVVVMPIPNIAGEITTIPISSKLVIFVLPLSKHTVFYECSNSNRVHCKDLGAQKKSALFAAHLQHLKLEGDLFLGTSKNVAVLVAGLSTNKTVVNKTS
jgi:hypothetical protein